MDTDTNTRIPSRAYELDCVDCTFEATVEGDVFEVFDVIEAHQEETLTDRFEHFVEFEAEMSDGASTNGQD